MNTQLKVIITKPEYIGKIYTAEDVSNPEKIKVQGLKEFFHTRYVHKLPEKCSDCLYCGVCDYDAFCSYPQITSFMFDSHLPVRAVNSSIKDSQCPLVEAFPTRSHYIYSLIDDAATWLDDYFDSRYEPFDFEVPRRVLIPKHEINGIKNYFDNNLPGSKFYKVKDRTLNNNIRSLIELNETDDDLPNKLFCEITWHLAGGITLIWDPLNQKT